MIHKLQNMKKLQFLPLMALVLGLGLTISMSSFSSNANLGINWYPVSTDGNTITSSTPISEPQQNGEGCAKSNDQSVCAVKLDLTSTSTVPATVSAATTAGYFLEDANRDL